ncbi:MAG TPA: sensor histidine kinase [Bradyrhizobium sp.]|jgi:two-component sensor histidine kinase|nr:sensor histidine kinase [Bradyrhizobium sp.]
MQRAGPVAGSQLKSRESVLRAMASSTYSTSEVLLQEITHRVNNEFASAIQVVSFAAAKSPDHNVKAALAGVMEQLHNYARVHHALQMPASNDCIDASAYLRELCGSISRSKLENRNVELVLVESQFQMSSERCWLLGMIVAELITNAVRHAFGQKGGTIRIECRVSGAFVECRVSDNGSGLTANVRPGSGLRIIEALAQKLDAEFQFNFKEGGSESVLILPIEHDRCVDPTPVRRAANRAAHVV